MPRKNHLSSITPEPEAPLMSIENLGDDLDQPSIVPGMPSKPKTVSIITDTKHVSALLEKILEKELQECAHQQGIEPEELRAWLSLQKGVSIKAQMHLLRTANRYELDPTQEEVAILQSNQSAYISISVDGWLKIINRHPSFTGISFQESPQTDPDSALWVECTIYRSDRTIPITIREYLSEVKHEGELWGKMPRRMLRHRSIQQCARIAMAIHIAEPKEQEEDVNRAITKDTDLKPQGRACDKTPVAHSARLKQILQKTS
jgi:hypothetical protein